MVQRSAAPGEPGTHLAIDEAVRSLFADPDWTFKLGIGCLINGAAFALILFNIILLPICFCFWSLVAGYLLLATSSKVNEPDGKLPSWSNVLELLMAGGTWIGASFLHCCLFVLTALCSLILGEITGLDNILAHGFLLWATGSWTFVLLLSAVVSLFSLYLMVNFSVQQNIASAFSLPEVWRRMKRQPRQFLEAWLIYMGLVYAAVLIPAATVLGIFVIPSTLFLAQLVGSSIVSQAWRTAEIRQSD